jgi:23S rRNA pseudouridine2605 synthase
MRINRFLARAGVASRRGAEALVTTGRVRVNGETVTNLATTIDPDRDRVELDGAVLRLPKVQTTVVLNKPAGYVVTMSDPQGRPTVTDLIPGMPAGVVPVGRLDAATEGLLILTDDGELAHRIAHPSFELEKVYELTAEGEMTEETRLRLEGGVELEGRRTAPAVVRVLGTEDGRTMAEITIHEGRKRQVRRMLELVGHRVLELRRTRVGPVGLGDLKSGSHRPLTASELADLRDALGLDGK